jgi:hypothetical protein
LRFAGVRTSPGQQSGNPGLPQRQLYGMHFNTATGDFWPGGLAGC